MLEGRCQSATLASPREGRRRVNRSSSETAMLLFHRILPMRIVPTLAAVLTVLLPLPVLASSCAEQIGTIERRLDNPGAIQVAGLQDGHVVRTGSPKGITTAHFDAPSDPRSISTSDHVAIARTLLVRASVEDQRGDKRACENTMTEAKGMIGALP